MPLRILSAEVRYVLTELDANGHPIGEMISQPMRVFRAVHPDIWTHGEQEAFAKDAPRDAFGYALGEKSPAMQNAH